MPACPASAMISPRPAAAIGVRVDRSSTARLTARNCAAVSKSTTLRTSAMTDSNPMAAETGAQAVRTAP